MSKHVSNTVTHTCDVCGNECEPIKEIKIPFRYFMDLVNVMEVRIRAHKPYEPDASDVCTPCAKRLLKEWADKP